MVLDMPPVTSVHGSEDIYVFNNVNVYLYSMENVYYILFDFAIYHIPFFADTDQT